MSTTRNETVKVKIFYTVQGAKFKKLTSTEAPTIYNSDAKKLVSLRSCLLSICSASPDIICRDHDLSIYTANLEETDQVATTTINHDSLVWEGHGLMSWILNTSQQQNNDIYVPGRQRYEHDNDHESTILELHINLQPTLKWTKDDFQQALRHESFEQLKQSSSSPNQHLKQCNCFEMNDHPHHQSLSSVHSHTLGALSPPMTLSAPSGRHTVLPSLTATVPPPKIHRPEPIFPSTTVSSSNVDRITPPPIYDAKTESTSTAAARFQQPKQPYAYRQEHPPPLPIPNSLVVNHSNEQNRKSAFTLAAGSSDFKRKSSDKSRNNLMPLEFSSTTHYPFSSVSYSSSSSASSSPSVPQLPSETVDTLNKHSIHTLDGKLTDSHPNNNNSKKRRRTSSMTAKHPTHKAHHALTSNRQQKQLQSCAESASNQPKSLPPAPSLVPAQQHQISTAVRTYYEVERDINGNYILPVEIDSWTVVNLGTVIYDRPAYHNQRYIYPVNYTVKKWYRSMVDPQADTQYTCRILENGREPRFEVTADDCDMTYSGATPTTVWTIIVRRAFNIRNQEYGHNPVGPDFFGLRKNTIAKMIQDLPNASKCSRYVWQNFEPAKFNKPGSRTRRRTTDLSGQHQQYSLAATTVGNRGPTVAPVIKGGHQLYCHSLSNITNTAMSASTHALIGGLNYGLTNGNRTSQQQHGNSINATKKGGRKTSK